MYMFLVFNIAAFGSDIYTAIVLLAFDRWSSMIEPVVPFYISRWLFAGCILLSCCIVFVELIIALRIIKKRNISLTYTNTIARNYYSVRDYNYFCLFAKITRSRNKVEYTSLFVYFAGRGWVKLIFAESPRQVINAVTLYSVLNISTSFVASVKELAQSSNLEAFTVCLMVFSLVIWAISMTKFLLAVIMSPFVYVQVEKAGARGLEEYCCVRINKRIKQLVEKNIQRDRLELIRENKRMSKQPTLPAFHLRDEEDAFPSSSTSMTSSKSTSDSSSSLPSKNLHKRTPSRPDNDENTRAEVYWRVPPAGSDGRAQAGTPRPPHKRLASEYNPFERRVPKSQPLPVSRQPAAPTRRLSSRGQRVPRKKVSHTSLREEEEGKGEEIELQSRRPRRPPPLRNLTQQNLFAQPLSSLSWATRNNPYSNGPPSESRVGLLSPSDSTESLGTFQYQSPTESTHSLTCGQQYTPSPPPQSAPPMGMAPTLPHDIMSSEELFSTPYDEASDRYMSDYDSEELPVSATTPPVPGTGGASSNTASAPGSIRSIPSDASLRSLRTNAQSPFQFQFQPPGYGIPRTDPPPPRIPPPHGRPGNDVATSAFSSLASSPSPSPPPPFTASATPPPPPYPAVGPLPTMRNVLPYPEEDSVARSIRREQQHEQFQTHPQMAGTAGPSLQQIIPAVRVPGPPR